MHVLTRTDSSSPAQAAWDAILGLMLRKGYGSARVEVAGDGTVRVHLGEQLVMELPDRMGGSIFNVMKALLDLAPQRYDRVVEGAFIYASEGGHATMSAAIDDGNRIISVLRSDP